VARTINEGELIRTRGVVGYERLTRFVLFLISDDCMAQTERLQEAFQSLVILMGRVADVLIELSVLKVDICHTRRILYFIRLIYTILVAAS